MKTYRRFIRVNGELQTSPRFTKKVDAEKWYTEMRRKKQFIRDGFVVDDKKHQATFIDFARDWMQKRMSNYPMATWKSDEQRLRDYILPYFSEIPIASITAVQIKTFLIKISEPGMVKEGLTISESTRTRIKALLSVIFSDALNEDPPLVSFNPVLGIKIKGKRKGRFKPMVLKDAEECLKFIETAKDIGWTHYALACFFLMTGFRKQELIALRWSCIDFKQGKVSAVEKYEQASGLILPGTKGGEDEVRTVYIPGELIGVLKEHLGLSAYRKPSDFVFVRPDGKNFGAREISNMVEAIRAKACVDITTHGLRHTFGREFAERSGNMKALQAILGHASSATTDIYSELAGSRIKGFAETVSFQKVVKKNIG